MEWEHRQIYWNAVRGTSAEGTSPAPWPAPIITFSAGVACYYALVWIVRGIVKITKSNNETREWLVILGSSAAVFLMAASGEHTSSAGTLVTITGYFGPILYLILWIPRLTVRSIRILVSKPEGGVSATADPKGGA